MWETEFTTLKPKPSGSGQRLYRRKDVEHVLEIKRLLYQERFTIEGARKHMEIKAKTGASGLGKPLKAKKAMPKTQATLFGPDSSPALEKVRDELKALLTLLK